MNQPTKETGPCYGVELIREPLPISGGMLQAMPSRSDLEGVRNYKQGERVVSAFEVLTHHYKHLRDAVERSAFDIAPCRVCGEAVVCVPDGLPFCNSCGEEE